MDHVTINHSISINFPKEMIWWVLTGYTWGQEFMEDSTVVGDYVPAGTLLYKELSETGISTEKG